MVKLTINNRRATKKTIRVELTNIKSKMELNIFGSILVTTWKDIAEKYLFGLIKAYR